MPAVDVFTSISTTGELGMIRREFLRSGAALTVMAALPRGAFADAPFTPKPDAWRKFEITTRVEIVNPSGKVQVWLPLPAAAQPHWTQPLRKQRASKTQSAVLKPDPD